MAKFRQGISKDQLIMFPQSLDEYVGEEDVCRYVESLVEEFDLSSIESKYSDIGRRAYSPSMLVKLLLYGKLRGVSSSRELARACKENVRFMYLVGNERPDFRTISDFRKAHIKELGGLLKQTVRIGLSEGIITLEHVAIDGTKIKANASRNSFKSPEKLEQLLRSLEESLSEDVDLDEQEDDEHGDDDGEPKLPKSLRGKRELSERLRAALSANEELAANKRAKAISRTDPDASFMRSKDGKHPCYNGQAAVDVDSYMVVAGCVSTVGSDHGELKSVLEAVEETTGKNPEQVSTDKGYRGSDGLVELEGREIDGVIPLQDADSSRFSYDDFVYDQKEDEYICPAGQALPFVSENSSGDETYKSEGCSGCGISSYCLRKPGTTRTLKVSAEMAAIQRMRHRLKKDDVKAVLRKRAQSVELTFAWLKAHKKMRQFIFRGLNAVRDLWNFELAALNVQRLINVRIEKKLESG